MTCCGGSDRVCRVGTVPGCPVVPRPSVPLPTPWSPGRIPIPQDARHGTVPVEAAQLATVLSAIAHHGAAGTDRPSALRLYVVANRVAGLAAGVYRYRTRANALAQVGAAQSAGRLASCAAEPAPLLGADVVLGLAGRDGLPRRHEVARAEEDGGGPVVSAYRVVRLAAALGLTGTVVAGFVDGIGELLGLPPGNPCCVLVALTRASADHS